MRFFKVLSASNWDSKNHKVNMETGMIYPEWYKPYGEDDLLTIEMMADAFPKDFEEMTLESEHYNVIIPKIKFLDS